MAESADAEGQVHRRFAMPARSEMSERQQAFSDKFLGFSLNGVRGPLRLLVRRPEVAELIVEMGRCMRFGSPIEVKLTELLVLVHARLWNDQYEWALHSKRAVEEGIRPAIVASLREGRIPAEMTDEEEVVFRFTFELETMRRVSDATFKAASDCFGETGVAELTITVGQYALISGILLVSEEGNELDGLPECAAPFAGYLAWAGN